MTSTHINTQPRPFLKWAGGKTQLLPAIERHLPHDFADQPSVTYIEPFVGGGALLFRLLSKYPNIRRAVINDINPHLINVYRTVQSSPETLIRLLQNLQSTYRSLATTDRQREFFFQIRKRFNGAHLSPEEDAAYMLFLNRTCFNGLYRENSRGEFNVAFGRYANPLICDADLIRADNRLLQKVEILQGDFSQIRDKVDGYTFVYFDPPYRPLNPGSFTSYSKTNFNDREQCRLQAFFTGLAEEGCHVLLSNSDGTAVDPANTYLDDLYRRHIISRVYARRSISRDSTTRGAIPELLIRSYPHTLESPPPTSS